MKRKAGFGDARKWDGNIDPASNEDENEAALIRAAAIWKQRQAQGGDTQRNPSSERHASSRAPEATKPSSALPSDLRTSSSLHTSTSQPAATQGGVKPRPRTTRLAPPPAAPAAAAPAPPPPQPAAPSPSIPTQDRRLEAEVLGGALWHDRCRASCARLPDLVPVEFCSSEDYRAAFEPLLLEEARQMVRNEFQEKCEAGQVASCEVSFPCRRDSTGLGGRNRGSIAPHRAAGSQRLPAS